jgi:hypothetical protein
VIYLGVMNTKPKLETWKVRTAKGRTHITVADSMVGVPQEVCLIYQCSMTEDRASLIASAPELRRKLVATQELARELRDAFERFHGFPNCSRARLLAQEALTKAKEVLG